MNTKLSTRLNVEQIEDLKEVAERYKELDEETIFSYLWKMTYDPEYALKKVGLTDEIYLKSYKKVRNYIFEEYGKPEILGDSDTYNPELLKALGQDKFAYCFICKKIQNAVCYYSENELCRISALLNSNLKNNQFGGLRSLGLTLSEANFFEQYEKAFCFIKNVFYQNFKEAFDNKITKTNVVEFVEEKKEDENKSEDLVGLFSKCVENKEELLKFFEYLTTMYKNYGINFEDFLEGYEFFKEYISLFETIKEKKIDINWLNENTDAIEQLLK